MKKPPTRHLPVESAKWGQSVDDRFEELAQELERLRGQLKIANKANTSTLNAASTTNRQVTETQAVTDARAQNDPNNLFDITPIVLRDPDRFWAARWYAMDDSNESFETMTPDITEWFADGFTIRNNIGPGAIIYIGNLNPFAFSTVVQGVPRMSVVSSKPAPWGSGTPYVGTQVVVEALLWDDQGRRLGIPMDHGNMTRVPIPNIDSWLTTATYTAPTLVMDQGFPILDNTLPFQNTATWRPVMRFQFSDLNETITVRGFNLSLSAGSVDWQGTTVPADAVETLPQSKVENLITDLAGKAPTTHTHAQSDITNLTTDLAGKAPTSHTHTAAQTTSGVFAAARLPQATETAIGALEIATSAEVTAGTDAVRAVTPIRLKERLDALTPSGTAVRAALFRDGTQNNIASGSWVKVPITSLTADRLDTTHFTRTTNGVTVTNAGLYQIFIEVVFAASTGGSARFAGTFIDNVESQMENGFRGTIPGFNLPATASGVRQLAAGGTIEMGANQNSGANLGFTVRRFGVVYLGA